MPNLTTKDGTPTGGVYGFATMALEVIKRLQPDYVCVAWDKAKTNIRSRTALYPAYKGNRKPPPPDFYEQIPILHDLLDALEWPLYEADDYEADDLMGAFAKQAGAKGIESYLITSDLDVLQLVNKHTHIYTLKKGLSNIELFDVSHFEEKYGVCADQWIDVKALKGDSSDNIPGVSGVGEKTALQLIKDYKTLDNVYEHLDDLKPALKAKLEKDKDMAYLSKKLVTLMVDAPIYIDLDEARLEATVTPEFVAMLRKLEFRNLLNKVEAVAPEAVVSEEAAQAALGLIEEEVEAAQIVPYDATAYANDQLRIIATDPDGDNLWISAKEGDVSIIPMAGVTQEIVTQLSSGPIMGHDLKTTLRVLLQKGITWPGKIGHDTRISAYLLNSLIRSKALADIIEQPVDEAKPEQVTTAIWKAYTDQRVELDEVPELDKLAQEIEFPTIKLLACVESRGILLDSDYLNKMSQDFEQQIRTLEQHIYEHAGQEFTIGSPQQLATILFEKIGLPAKGIKKGKTGYSTGASELDKLRALHPIIDLVTKWREYTKLKSTYIDALPKLVDSEGRLHTTYALDVAATGRLSSHDPNLQNIPTRTEMGQAIRTAFVPAQGNVFVSADYSQFELRLAAVMADDKKLIADFNADMDIHTATAAEVYGVPLDQVTKDMRRHAKTVNFGVLYGMSPHGLSIATGMTRDQAKDFIDKYFELRSPIRRYMDSIVTMALQDGYVATLFGRRRPTPDLKSSNFIAREAAKRAAINMPIQGTEADLMKLAMLRVEEKLGDLGKQILQIHDSILVECPRENAEKVSVILRETMETIHKLPVKLAVDVSSGNNWGEL